MTVTNNGSMCTATNNNSGGGEKNDGNIKKPRK